MNDADACNCFMCTFRRSLDEPLPTEQAQEPVTIPDSFQQAQENLVLAQTVDLLTMSMERAYNCNEDSVARGIGRTLEQLLATEGSVGTASETPADATEGTADAAARSANAPLQTEPSDFYGLPKEIDAIAKSLADVLGCDVQVMRFPKQ